MNIMSVLLVLAIVVVAIALHFFLKKFKIVNVGTLSMTTGGVKCGKSTFCVGVSYGDYKRRLRRVRFKNFIRRLFGKMQFEEPLYYSNIPMSFPYVPITEDLLLRKTRFRYGSVIYINEASLLASSQTFRDMDINKRLLHFNKLIGHETYGGSLYYDTQCIGDVHYSIKRSLSSYYHIYKCIKWVPFIIILKLREFHYSDDKSTINVVDKDAQEDLKTVILSKRTWKRFDAYCYSCFTDDLPVEDKLVYTDDLKARRIFSFDKNLELGGDDYVTNAENETNDR